MVKPMTSNEIAGTRHPNQELYLVNHNNYIYVVPVDMEPSSETALMRTIYPSRKYTREYLPKEAQV